MSNTENQTRRVGSKSKVVWMTELALLTAIVILMAFTPLGYLKVGAVEITFIVIPVAIGAVLLGVGAGAFLGLVFGLTSFAQCFGMSVFGTMMFAQAPIRTAIVCIVPRILVGVVPALVFMGLQKICKKRTINTAIACVLAPITNTVLYLGCMVFLVQDLARGAFGYDGKGGFAFLGFVLALVAVNAIVEALSCLFISTAITNVLWLTVNKNNK